MPVPPLHPRVSAARVLRPYVLALTFMDGSEGVVDLEPSIFEPADSLSPFGILDSLPRSAWTPRRER